MAVSNGRGKPRQPREFKGAMGSCSKDWAGRDEASLQVGASTQRGPGKHKHSEDTIWRDIEDRLRERMVVTQMQYSVWLQKVSI